MNFKRTKNNITAVILCGGQGQRLRPLTKDIPKPLIIIKDKPILFYIIEHLKKYNIDKFIIATGYKSKKIEDYMKQKFTKLNYRIINSGNVDILSRVKDSIKDLDDDVILNYGDTISNIDINKFIKFHNTMPKHVTISSYPIVIPFGVMTVDKNNIVRQFNEKPVLSEVMNVGYYYLPDSFKEIILKEKSLLNLISTLIKKKELKCYQHTGIHITINTIAELNNAEDNIKKIF